MEDDRLDRKTQTLEVAVEVGLNIAASEFDDGNVFARSCEGSWKAIEGSQLLGRVVDASSGMLEPCVLEVGTKFQCLRTEGGHGKPPWRNTAKRRRDEG